MEVGIITLLRDVSQERELDRMKREFIATAAHELRTPLTAVMGFSELLLGRKDLDESQQTEYLSIIHKKSEVLGKIVGDLLDLSRVDSGKVIRLKKDWAEIGSIIGRCTADYQRACPDHHFETVLPEKPVVAFLDDRKLFQVMENLLGNAVKFSPAGSLIRVACEVSEENVRIAVSDEGVGMTSDQVERVFDKFYRVDASNTAKEGLGLGMAIVKSIIEAHGCQIWVESEVGEGTKVTFTLPGMGRGED
jgi:signal transduction histidine kinase